MGSAGTDGTIQSYGWDGSISGFQILGGATPSITIIGGTITGGTVQTAISGARTNVSGNDITLYDDTSLTGGAIVGNSATIFFTRTDDNTKGFNIRKRVGKDYDGDNVLEFYAETPAASRFNAWFNGRKGNELTSNLGYYGVAISHDTSKALNGLNGQFGVDYDIDGTKVGVPSIYATHASLFLGAGNTGTVSLVIGSGTNGLAGMGYDAPQTIGDSTSQFDITDQGSGVFRYTWDGVGTDPFSGWGAYLKVGTLLKINAQNFNVNNNGSFSIITLGATYWEITNANGVAESNKTIGTGSIEYSLISYNLYTDGVTSIKLGGNLLPEDDNTYALGSGTKRFSSIFLDTLDGSGTINCGNDFNPVDNDTNSLGSGAKTWNYVYTNYVGDSTHGIGEIYFTSPSRTRKLYAASTYDIVASENFKVVGTLYATGKMQIPVGTNLY